MKNISLLELEALVTTQVLSKRLINQKTKQYRTKYTYTEALEQAMYALDDILVEREMNEFFWARIRGDRLYLFYLPLKRIAIEVGIVTDEAEGGLRSRFRVQFVGYRGKFPPATIADLIEILEYSSHKRKLERSKNDRNYRSKAK